jgi:hypothetical protein
MARRRRYTIEEYKKLYDIRCKAMLTIAVAIAFLLVLFRMLFFPSTLVDLGKCSIAGTFLARTIYVAFNHYYSGVKKSP